MRRTFRPVTKIIKIIRETPVTSAAKAAEEKVANHLRKGDYASALISLAPLKTPVDAFFDGVMVNAEEPALRQNRLALLSELHSLMNKFVDLSKLAT